MTEIDGTARFSVLWMGKDWMTMPLRSQLENWQRLIYAEIAVEITSNVLRQRKPVRMRLCKIRHD